MIKMILIDLFPQETRSHSTAHFPDILSEIQINTPPGLVINQSEDIQIKFDKGGAAVRKVNKRSNFRVTGFFPSQKNKCVQPYESPIELSGLLYLEASPIVRSYQVQPAYIAYSLNGKKHTHVPDVIVELTTGQMVFIEFKDITYLNDHHLVSRTQHLQKTLPTYGYSYLVIVPDQMPAILQANCEDLTRMAVKKVGQEIRETIRMVMRKLGVVSLESLLSVLSPINISKGVLFALILGGDIQINWVTRLNKDSLLVWRDQA